MSKREIAAMILDMADKMEQIEQIQAGIVAAMLQHEYEEIGAGDITVKRQAGRVTKDYEAAVSTYMASLDLTKGQAEEVRRVILFWTEPKVSWAKVVSDLDIEDVPVKSTAPDAMVFKQGRKKIGEVEL
jgi:5'-deoxynucleotidase YfbR-like HD superfamily hydrolase